MGGSDFSLYTVYKIIKVNCSDTVHPIGMKRWGVHHKTLGKGSVKNHFFISQGWRHERLRFFSI